MKPIKTVFLNLNRWRHLPAYQLERRADIFFSVYLPTVLEEFTGKKLAPTIIPEFPIKRDLISLKTKNNLSVKVDYVLFAEDLHTTFFIELKTDTASRKEAQDEYLAKAKEIGFTRILAGLCEILQSTNAYQKYYHLLHMLKELGFLEIPEDIEQYIYPKPKQGLRRRFREITINPVDTRIEVVYVQPTDSCTVNCISFKYFADTIENFRDPLSVLFREHLKRWQQPAGSIPPT